ncbi:tRNA (adenosine(37)-N6)-threonylcarbamoyltransferase complex dimerization subunit type 1 TsaB [Pseudoalteromonas peptidolytica]|uniref:tRNA (adenosine(37)-N6)-threonylcarbamoyltransferase complex dimerization subunit type 1 TsaB n=1 Tax=Pseudoalteromonas peptidolytica TaxID=61150 RepID=UPI00116D522E|nr:tRNA (adenosine(37)-N6)-threonylcarbamoyltransferase complex dimerization subunit type 1 TsaB [Pseudoalteromonas peptidolytica]NLR15079.1 tRNA (adenosine(37)-N6)-threonylcarbamoyltransferase complex dimerization subunit type 1 TsaB [Pseudoalteromonas peptidolytica]GEK09381.1 tRNA (adenosine(37)-N6)-threonylcarbamoyltransferase complex dimerization subunit type 1 TsaB [Pseudoalteromonas peptidolytica]
MKNNLLAIDASTEALSIALHYEGKFIRHFEVCPQQHSQKILPLVERILREADITLNELDGIVFGRGPGSFTGVRISTAVAQGLAYSSGLKLVGVSTLHAMAQQVWMETGKDNVVSAIDARMGEIYLCQYNGLNGRVIQATSEETVIKPENIDFSVSGAVGVGTGWQAFPELASQLACEELDSITLPDAYYMLFIADDAFTKGLSVDAAEAQPQYVRDTVTWKKLPGRE